MVARHIPRAVSRIRARVATSRRRRHLRRWLGEDFTKVLGVVAALHQAVATPDTRSQPEQWARFSAAAAAAERSFGDKLHAAPRELELDALLLIGSLERLRAAAPTRVDDMPTELLPAIRAFCDNVQRLRAASPTSRPS